MTRPLLDHVQLPMPPGGSDAARRFYRDALGLHEVAGLSSPGQPCVLRFVLEGFMLDLREGRYTGVAPQAHLALRFAELAPVLQRLRAGGHPVDAWALADAGRASTEDPFGNRLELVELAPLPPLHVKDHHVTQIRLSS
ncbi:VOC family protein [Azohydromonas aeria]|uniref:VOC family protein n=1 Tax=Azohydromonas aeria TaxID=2590212 RepID=UPI0012FAC05B|nr:VOC family protein [Azohydromonas aeria]